LKTAPVLPSRSSDATLWINKLNLASKHCDATRAGAMEIEVGLAIVGASPRSPGRERQPHAHIHQETTWSSHKFPNESLRELILSRLRHEPLKIEVDEPHSLYNCALWRTSAAHGSGGNVCTLKEKTILLLSIPGGRGDIADPYTRGCYGVFSASDCQYVTAIAPV